MSKSKLQVMRWTLQLHVASRAEIDGLPDGKLQDQLLDEGGHVAVGAYPAHPALDTEDLPGHLHPDVAPHGHLAGQAFAVGRLPLGDVGGLGGQQAAAALQHLDPALPAGPATATGGGDVEAGPVQGLVQLEAHGHLQAAFVVDHQGRLARGNQPASG